MQWHCFLGEDRMGPNDVKGICEGISAKVTVPHATLQHMKVR